MFGLSALQLEIFVMAYVFVVVISECTLREMKQESIQKILSVYESLGMNAREISYEKERLNKMDRWDVLLLAERVKRQYDHNH